jgi:excisionase family DNA binding protein
MDSQEREFLTVEEAAELLRVDETTVRRALREGELPGQKIGRVWRIPKADLLRYMRGEWEPGARG